MKRNIIINIVVTLSTLVVIGLIIVSYFIIKNINKNNDNDDLITITIHAKDVDGNLVINKELEVKGGQTLYQILNSEFTIIMGTGANDGMLVGFSEISSSPSENIWFIIYINGDYAMYGIKDYIPIDEDIILFALETY